MKLARFIEVAFGGMFQKHKMACAKVKVRGMCSQGVPGDEAKQRSFVLQTFQMPEFNKAA